MLVVAAGCGGHALVGRDARPAPAHGDRAALMAVHRGGTLKLLAVSGSGTIDPQVNYWAQYWQLFQVTHDGLLAFKKAGGDASFQVVPDLAEAIPQPTNGGRTWVFKLRQGIRFSNGKTVTATDVAAPFRRIVKVLSPTAGTFYAGIVGAPACLAKPRTCTLAGGVIANDSAGTVTINLVAADPEFKYKLAVPHASIVPAGSPATDAGAKPLPGTGAYKFSSYDPNRGLTLDRNRYFKQWSRDAQPDGYVDRITYTYGRSVASQVTSIQNGQADWTYEAIPPDRLGEIGRRYAGQVHVNRLTAIWYLAMNTRIAPFDNLKARRAVNLALDRRAAVGILGGPRLARPSCQVLPVGFPGHRAYCPYTKHPGARWSAPDVATAKRLVRESGTTGARVVVLTADDDVDRTLSEYVQSVLSSLGYRASVRKVSPNVFSTYPHNTKNRVQISVQGWYPDYPAASNFLRVLFGCDSFQPASDSNPNIAGFCRRGIDARMRSALKLALTNETAANAAWAKIDRMVTDAAPLATLFDLNQLDFVSKRVGNFRFSEQSHWLLAEAWVR